MSFLLSCHISKLCSPAFLSVYHWFIDPIHAELQVTVTVTAVNHQIPLTSANGKRCNIHSWNKWESIIMMTKPAGPTEVSSLLLNTVLVKQSNTSGTDNPRQELLLFRMNMHETHWQSCGFSTFWCGRLCFVLNTCHRRCQITWINGVVKIIRAPAIPDKADSLW